MENLEDIDQKRAKVLTLLATRAALFARQGTVQPTWRTYQGQRCGPYFYLVWREGGGQRRHYLGADSALVAEVRARLEVLQAPRREDRQMAQVVAAARAALRGKRRDLALALAQLGLELKGWEVRGWRRRGGAATPPLSQRQET